MHTDAVTAAIQQVAEDVVRPRWRSLAAGEVIEKKPGDLVTVADREAEAALTQILLADDPRALVVGEEATFADPGRRAGLATAPHAWTVDPVDGTRNFVHGSPDYAVMVAELRHGVTERAWIWQPELGHLFYGEHGGGVSVDGTPLARHAPQPPYRGAGSRDGIRGWQSPEVLPIGRTAFCCGVDYPRLLAGEWDFVVYFHANPWDHLPGALMLRELGGVVRMRGGDDYGPATTGTHLMAAAGPETFQAVAPVWGDGLEQGSGG